MTHVVLMTFLDPSDAPEAARRLRSMEGRVPSLASIEVGLHDGVDPRGAHLALLTRHADRPGLQAYAAHPAHQEVLAWLRPRLAGAQVVDFA